MHFQSEGDDDTKQVKANTQQNEQANDDEAIEVSLRVRLCCSNVVAKIRLCFYAVFQTWWHILSCVSLRFSSTCLVYTEKLVKKLGMLL